MKAWKPQDIILQPFSIDDADAAFHLFSLKEVVDFYDNKPIEYNESPMVFTYRLIKGSNHIWKVAFNHDADTLIGVCALHKWDATKKTIEIGGTLLPQFWNQNIMGLAFQQVIDFVKHEIGAHRILARTSPTNIQAIKLVEKLGFEHTHLSVNEIELALSLNNQTNILQKTINCLNEEGTILYPTDTIWGLGANALSKTAVQKINLIKNRPAEKSYILLMKNVEVIEQFCAFDPQQIQAILDKAERPTTVIYPLNDERFHHITASDNTIAIRIPKTGFVKYLVEAIDYPLISTSANISGSTTPKNFDEVDEQLKNQVDFIVPYPLGNNENASTMPSTILKITDTGDIITLRD